MPWGGFVVSLIMLGTQQTLSKTMSFSSANYFKYFLLMNGPSLGKQLFFRLFLINPPGFSPHLTPTFHDRCCFMSWVLLDVLLFNTWYAPSSVLLIPVSTFSVFQRKVHISLLLLPQLAVTANCSPKSVLPFGHSN